MKSAHLLAGLVPLAMSLPLDGLTNSLATITARSLSLEANLPIQGFGAVAEPLSLVARSPLPGGCCKGGGESYSTVGGQEPPAQGRLESLPYRADAERMTVDEQRDIIRGPTVRKEKKAPEHASTSKE